MNYFAVGFGAVALVAVGVIDYSNQASAAGQAPGQYAPGAYLSSFAERFGSMRVARAEAADEKARAALRRAGARAYLPAAPEGWSRRGWSEGDNSALEAARPPLTDAQKASYAMSPMLRDFDAKAERSAEARLDRQSWVYQSASGQVAVSASYHPRDPGASIGAAARDVLAASGAVASGGQPGWGVVQGVAFGMADADTGPAASRAGTPFRVLQATLGFDDAVHLEVRSSADDAAMRALLDRIDYDGLNRLLSAPLPDVGSQAPAVPEELQPRLAGFVIELHEALLTRRGEAALAWLERAATPGAAMQLATGEVMAAWQAGRPAPALLDPPQDASAAAGAARLGVMVKGIFGGNARQDAKAAPAEAPRRLNLSGGATCLEGSAGRFCRD